MTETLAKLLLRQSEAGEPALLWGRQAAPFFGREFDRLLSQGVLIEEAPATDWAPCPDCECGLDSRRVQNIAGHLVASCPVDRTSDTVLSADHLRSFRIVPAVLVREIAAASGFGDAPSDVVPGVWRLGLAASNRAVFLALSGNAVLQPGLIGTLRLVDRSSPITVIAPALAAAEQTRFAEAGVFLVAIDSCLGADSSVSFAIDPGRLEPTLRLAPRLVIHQAAKSAELDGVACALSDQTFALLVLMAERLSTKSPFVSAGEIEARIWGTLIHLVAREARDVVRELRSMLSAGAADPTAARRLIENKRSRGWRLRLTAEEVEFRP